MAATFATHISPFHFQTESNLKWFTLIYDSGSASLSPSLFFLLRHLPICLLTLWWLSRKCEKSWIMLRADVEKKTKSKMLASNVEHEKCSYDTVASVGGYLAHLITTLNFSNKTWTDCLLCRCRQVCLCVYNGQMANWSLTNGINALKHGSRRR